MNAVAFDKLLKMVDQLDNRLSVMEEKLGISMEEDKLTIEHIRKFIRPNERPGRFRTGDKVIHLNEGKGVVVENISNEFAEVYKVKYENGHTFSSSEGLLCLQTIS